MVRVIHLRSMCIGCNACVEADRNRWRMSRKDGKSVLIGGIENKGIYKIEVDDEEHKALLKAAANCPVKIIKVEKA
ncbi:MAG TPA: ferredoxin [Bacteroidia bacterium]